MASRNTLPLARLALFVCIATLATAASAQIGIYVGPDFTRVSNSTPDPGVYAALGANATSRIFSGVDAGVYDQFFHNGRLDAGADLRASIQKGANAHLNEFLVGARVAFRPISFPLRPYAEVLAGVGTTRAATNPVSLNRATYGGFAGLEYPAGKYLDLRVIEVGYSSLQTVSTASVTGVGTVPSASQLIHFSAGLVFRIPQPHLIP